jgi:hypothetical protein
MKKISAICVFVTLCSIAIAQSKAPPPLSLSVAFFGETLSHPGISVNIEYGLLNAGSYSLSLAAETGWYVHPRNHSAFFLGGGISNRLSGSSPLWCDLALLGAYLSSVPDGEVYSRDANGLVAPAGAPVGNKLMVLARIGAGFAIGPSSGIHVSPYLRLGVFGEYPFNGYLYPHLFVETGVEVPLPEPKASP